MTAPPDPQQILAEAAAFVHDLALGPAIRRLDKQIDATAAQLRKLLDQRADNLSEIAEVRRRLGLPPEENPSP